MFNIKNKPHRRYETSGCVIASPKGVAIQFLKAGLLRCARNDVVIWVFSFLLPALCLAAPTPQVKLPTQPVPISQTLCGQKLYDTYPWASMAYYGITGSNALAQILRGDLDRWPEHIQSLELAYTLNEHNVVRQFFSPLVGVVQLAANYTVRHGRHESTVYEFNPYIGWRWANFPWNHYVNTSFSIGEGISYGTSVPSLEKRSNENTKRLLNYLMLEATFAAPQYPRAQMVVRIHHRSGAFGLYGAGNTGSNDIGLGLRYLFG